MGCLAMISNSEIPNIRELCDGWNFVDLPVVRFVAANGERHKVNGLVISNYYIEEDNNAKV